MRNGKYKAEAQAAKFLRHLTYVMAEHESYAAKLSELQGEFYKKDGRLSALERQYYKLLLSAPQAAGHAAIGGGWA